MSNEKLYSLVPLYDPEHTEFIFMDGEKGVIKANCQFDIYGASQLRNPELTMIEPENYCAPYISAVVLKKDGKKFTLDLTEYSTYEVGYSLICRTVAITTHVYLDEGYVPTQRQLETGAHFAIHIDVYTGNVDVMKSFHGFGDDTPELVGYVLSDTDKGLVPTIMNKTPLNYPPRYDADNIGKLVNSGHTNVATTPNNTHSLTEELTQLNTQMTIVRSILVIPDRLSKLGNDPEMKALLVNYLEVMGKYADILSGRLEKLTRKQR